MFPIDLNKAEYGCESVFVPITKTVAIKFFWNKEAAMFSREVQEACWHAGIAPKAGRKVFCLYGFWGHLTEIVDGPPISKETYHEGSLELEMRNSFIEATGKDHHDIHRENVRFFEGFPVIIDFGPYCYDWNFYGDCEPEYGEIIQEKLIERIGQ